MSNENPTAFPVNDANLGGPGAYSPEPGMLLRDYFAAKAMQSLISPVTNMPYLAHHKGDETAHDRWVASRAYEIADKMLAARKP